MATFAETIKEIDVLRHKKAVWEAIIDHLDRYADDGTSDAEYQVVADEAVEKVVPVDIIQQFIDEAVDETKSLTKRIKEVEGSKVVPLEEKANTETSDGKQSKQPTKGKPLKLGKKGKKANKG